MANVVPHINTLIVDIGTEYARVGYAGDFLPFKTCNTSEVSPGLVVNSVVTDPERFVDAMAKLTRGHGVDTIIIIEHTSQPESIQREIATFLASKRICRSYFFMKSGVCELFGHGKTSGTVFSCSAGSITISVITEGRLVDHYKIELAEPNLLGACDSKEAKEDMLSNKSNYEGEKHAFINQVFAGLDQLIQIRETHKMKKPGNNGFIILAGGYMNSKELVSKCKEYIVYKTKPSVNELILHDSGLIACFSGASIFGQNDETKVLFSVVK